MSGGISYIANRCAEANNKYLKDSDKPSNCITYLIDSKNLYGWLSKKELIFEVDLEYPEELHEEHNIH